MRLVVTLFILVLSISACKKGGSSAEEVDPREQYVGTYDIDYSSTTVILPSIKFNEETNKGTIAFTKGEGANEMSMVISFPNFSATEIVKLSGTQFTMNRTRDKMPFGNKIYDAEFTGSGTFEGRNLTLTSITKLNEGGTVVQWNRAYKGLKR
ncbi:hypothetical protein GCM10027299_22210 [Larkinella ripae]